MPGFIDCVRPRTAPTSAVTCAALKSRHSPQEFRIPVVAALALQAGRVRLELHRIDAGASAGEPARIASL